MNQLANSTPKFNLTKSEILRHKKVIEDLFQNGISFKMFPLMVIYKTKADENTQVLFSVPKKKFKNAVERNKIKRRLREAYRLNKHILRKNDKVNFNIAYIYISDQSLPYQLIQEKITLSLEKLVKLT